MPGVEKEPVGEEAVEWPAAKVRQTFIDFFVGKGHINWKSSPWFPSTTLLSSLPTQVSLIFGAGLVSCFLLWSVSMEFSLRDEPIQAHILGDGGPHQSAGELVRACNSQKCIRAGGKHNDLDDVGKDTYHHTFFEMLGNWSFGDYFKREAIDWAWELLTETPHTFANENEFFPYFLLKLWRISVTVLMIFVIFRDAVLLLFDHTYRFISYQRIGFMLHTFGGDEKAGLSPDFEARDKWLSVLPAGHVLPFGCKDNFWEMGDTGPCGPCTEIHFDRIGNRDAASLVNNDDPHALKYGTLYLFRYNYLTMSNYDTDIFMPIFNAIQQVTGFPQEYSGKVGEDDVGKVDMAYRVVADHIRTLSFAIADGSRPGNEGREYVLRRILRRAVRYGRDILKADEGFFSSLVGLVVNVMGDFFPELKQHESKIRDIISEEEASFGRTILKGIDKFKKAAQEVQGKKLSGQDAFVLWDTYGFPIDLTQLMAEERGLTVDIDGYNVAMEEARQKARSARNRQVGESIAMDADATSVLHKSGVAPTDDSSKYTWNQDHESVIKAIYTGAEFQETVSAGADVGIVLESTSFYAEQGGQIYDTGSIEGAFGSFRVNNVQVYGGFVLHIGSFNEENGVLSVGDKVACKVDYARRTLIAPNHTCTHMLNFALREVLGDHVDQKGSIVLPEKLRFDFSHGKPIQPEDLGKIESIVNQQIEDQLDVFATEASLAAAKSISGLRAVFGEVYPDPVRVVSIGQKVEDLLLDPENEKWLSISTEFCGGTHLSNTREAKAFALLSEEGIAKGVRRITAVTTECAITAIDLAHSFDGEIDDASQTDGGSLEKKVASLKGRIEAAAIPAFRKAQLKGRLSQLQDQIIASQKMIGKQNIHKAIEAATQMAEAAAAEGRGFCVFRVDVGLDTNAIREAVLKVVEQKGIAVMIFSTDEASSKAVVYAGVPDKIAKDNVAVKWLKAALEPLKGKGGGRVVLLRARSGTDTTCLVKAMDIATEFAKLQLS
ncbi:unnamed protein product [Spirodela intermedia]|uniref:Alanine--tRNA ligase n=1 Tax=Spirodela intermedia TaxID=51605 RepID=A0A7I8JKB9_SPIIN|nr:unnamed protein product [Spirodela intermedia]CAA6670626.1 unnamed protein product [Spirodela intermedia]